MMGKTRGDIRLYHVDHLGSTTLVTDIDGEITQHVAYIPYGEVFVEQRNGSWNTPYLFNAKELDEETGLYYYGARYLDPNNAAWLSVDPMFEKGMGMSPYAYCFGNPVKLQDPNGEWPWGDWPGVTYTFQEVEIGAGMGYGLNAVEQYGTAYDEVGYTRFKMLSYLYVANQDLTTGSKEPELIAGISTSMNIGVTFDWSHQTFLADASTYNGEYGLDVKAHEIIGIGLGIGKKRFGISAGIGVGVKISVVNTQIAWSVSLTDYEAASTWWTTKTWRVVNRQYNEKDNQWTGNLEYADFITGSRKISDILVTSENIYDEKTGMNRSSEIWASQQYRKEAQNVEGE